MDSRRPKGWGAVLLLASLLVLAGAPDAQDGYEIAKLVAPDGAPGDKFGWAVAIDGDIAAVGAPWAAGGENQGGSVYVFERMGMVGLGSSSLHVGWRFRKKVSSSGAEGFGLAVAVGDGLLLVGAPNSRDAGHDEAGLVIGFRRNLGGLNQWGEAFRMQSPVPHTWGNFGESLQIDGDTLVIGAGRHWGGGPGEAFVYTSRVGLPDDWKLAASLTASGSYGLYYPWAFGHHVSIDGDSVLVASDDYPYSSHSGGLHVFDRDAGGPDRWGEVAFLESPTGIWDDRFGQFGSELAGNTIFVTAENPGSVFRYERDLGGPNAWGLAMTITQEEALALTMDGEFLVVGSPWPWTIGATPFVRVYARDLDGPDSWPPVADLQASDAGDLEEGFGFSVAMDGDDVLVGNDDNECAYVFDLTPPGSASVVFRTDSGGANPASYTGTPPVIGASYDAVVDLTTTGHAFAVLFAYDTAAEWPLGTGYVLLCRDQGSGPLFPFLVAVGPLASFTLPIPDDPRLFGLPLFTQAAHFGGLRPFALSNAQDLVLGYE